MLKKFKKCFALAGLVFALAFCTGGTAYAAVRMAEIPLYHHHSESCIGYTEEEVEADGDRVTYLLSEDTCPLCGGIVHYYQFRAKCSCGRVWDYYGYACYNSIYGDNPSGGCSYYSAVGGNTKHTHSVEKYVCEKDENTLLGKITIDASETGPVREMTLSAEYSGTLEKPEYSWTYEEPGGEEKTLEGTAEEPAKGEETSEGRTEGAASEEGAEEESTEGTSGEGETHPQKSSSITVKKNGIYTLTAGYEEDGKEYRAFHSVTVSNIDRKKPKAQITKEPENWESGDCTVTVDAKDESGLCEEPYSYDGGETWTSENTFTVSESGNLIICIKDLAGNIRKETVELKKIPKENTGGTQGNTGGSEEPRETKVSPASFTKKKKSAEPVGETGSGENDSDTDPGDEEDTFVIRPLVTGDLIHEVIKDEGETGDGTGTVEESPEHKKEKKPFSPGEVGRYLYTTWKEMPAEEKIVTVSVSGLIGAVMVAFGTGVLSNSASVYWVDEKNRLHFMDKAKIRKGVGKYEVRIRKEALLLARSEKLCIRMPGLFTLLHKYHPIGIFCEGSMYSLHVERNIHITAG